MSPGRGEVNGDLVGGGEPTEGRSVLELREGSKDLPFLELVMGLQQFLHLLESGSPAGRRGLISSETAALKLRESPLEHDLLLCGQTRQP